jgi:hypothetical protein
MRRWSSSFCWHAAQLPVPRSMAFPSSQLFQATRRRNDLANCLPDHQDWQRRAEEHLRREAECLKALLANEESRRR